MTCSSKMNTVAGSAAAGSPKASRVLPGSTRLVADHVDDPADVVMATETDRGLFVWSLVAAGYTVVAVNPLSVARYRERYSTSGAKSDPGDAKVLADLARTDGHNHRPLAGDSELGESIKVARSCPPEFDLGPAAAAQPASLDAARVLPGGAGSIPRAGQQRRVRRARGRVDTNAGPAAVASPRSRPRCDEADGNDASTSEPLEIQAALRTEQLAAPALVNESDGLGRPQRSSRSAPSSPPRSPGSRPSWRTVLNSTRTARSSDPCQD